MDIETLDVEKEDLEEEHSKTRVQQSQKVLKRDQDLGHRSLGTPGY